jgi:hypothetical protein
MDLIKEIGGPYTVSTKPSPAKKVSPKPEKKVSPKTKAPTLEKVSPKTKKGYVINPKTGREIKIGGATHAALVAAGKLGELKSKVIEEPTIYLVITYDGVEGVFDSEEKAKMYAKKFKKSANALINTMQLNKEESVM